MNEVMTKLVRNLDFLKTVQQLRALTKRRSNAKQNKHYERSQ